MFIFGIVLIITSFYFFFNKNSKEKEALFASFLHTTGLVLGLTKEILGFQIFFVIFAMLPLIALILIRTHAFIKNNKCIPGTAIKED